MVFDLAALQWCSDGTTTWLQSPAHEALACVPGSAADPEVRVAALEAALTTPLVRAGRRLRVGCYHPLSGQVCLATPAGDPALFGPARLRLPAAGRLGRFDGAGLVLPEGTLGRIEPGWGALRPLVHTAAGGLAAPVREDPTASGPGPHPWTADGREARGERLSDVPPTEDRRFLGRCPVPSGRATIGPGTVQD